MKKLTAILLIAMMMLGVLAGCNQNADPIDPAPTPSDPVTPTTPTEPVTPTEPEPADTGLLGEILSEGVLTMAVSPDFAPMEFIDTSKEGQDQYVGFDLTLARFIADELGVELKIEPMEFSACQAAVQMGRVDLSISGYSVTEERAQSFAFSDYYYPGDNETNQCIMVLKDQLDQYGTAESFAGKKVGAQLASLQYNLLTSQLPDAEAVQITDLNTAVLELLSGKIDALCVAKGNGEAYMANYDSLALSPWEFYVEDEGNVILLPKGEDALVEKINEILAKAYEAGYYDTWYTEAEELAGMETASEVTMPE